MTWILTYTGKRFDPMAPHPEDIDPIDIAHSLAHLCRFNGHVRQFYSVAEHSVHVAQIVSRENRLTALLHDAAEAYIGDITRPLKGAINDITGNVLSIIENDIHRAIASRFGIPSIIPAAVKHADMILLATERRDLMPTHSAPWACLDGIEPLERTIAPLSPDEAKELWMECFEELGGNIKGAAA